MTDKDFENVEQVKRLLKYIDKGKFDQKSWTNCLELYESLNILLFEHREYMEHMKLHH